MDTFIFDRTSIVRTIITSEDIRAKFKAHVDILETSKNARVSRIKDLHSAKQRFSSHQKPLVRFILYFDAIVAVAYELMTRRTGDKANRARAFLQKIDEERLLTLAMLADAGDEVAVLVRFFDTKDHDIAKVSSVLKNFMNRIDALFLQKRCLQSVDGCHTYTSFALELLREGKMLSIQEGRAMKVRSLKAVPPEVVDRCLSHMAAWVKLCVATVMGEFPDFEVMSAFSVFDLSLNETLGGDGFMTTGLRRLAKTFDIDHKLLRREFIDFRRTAVRKSKEGMSNYDAWRESVMSVEKSSSRTQQAHPRAGLRHALARYGAFIGAGTSTVERAFSSFVKAVGPQRKTEDVHNMSSDLRLKMLAGTDVNDNRIIHRSMQIWSSVFPSVRKSGNKRRTRWVSGLSRIKGTTLETAFTQKRQSAIKNILSTSRKRSIADVEADADHQSKDVWEAGHKQVPFLRALNCLRAHIRTTCVCSLQCTCLILFA